MSNARLNSRWTWILALVLVLAAAPAWSQISLKPVNSPDISNVAPEACEVTREEITSQLQAGVSADELADKYADCGGGAINLAKLMATTEKGAQAVIPLNIFFEELCACGYDPQSAVVDCSVQVSQQFGYAGTPGFGPGSPQWGRFCWVNPNGGIVDEGIFSVHVHDEPFGVLPPWHYGTRIQAPILQNALAKNGQTVFGFVIHSWLLPAPNCATLPPLPWGSIATFNMKLDP